MGKESSRWWCSSCGAQAAKWGGQCSHCGAWNTLVEERASPKRGGRVRSEAVPLSRITPVSAPRIKSGIAEWDRLIGGGLVPGALLLVGGEPGIGKSTLMLQLAAALARGGRRTLYVCGEESIEQTSLRARRLGLEGEELLLLAERECGEIEAQVEELNPALLIADSVQILYKAELPAAPGSIVQVRETAAHLMQLAKRRAMVTILIGHVTKSGEIAGPRLLEHLVDAVLYFEGEKQHHYRLVRVVKNRFGPTDEIALFQMEERGLVELPNPSEIFLEERLSQGAGSVVIPTLEGSRPILVEAQALVTETAFATPSRRCTGFDPNRLALLLAVLEKRMRYQTFRYDIFASIAGGVRISEPSVDLGILIAVASSLRGQAVNPRCCVMGEVGLGGEVRGVAKVESRIKEAVRMGFSKAIAPKRCLKGLSSSLSDQIAIAPVEVVDEAIYAAFN